MRQAPAETCTSAVAAVRQLRALARRTGYSPSRTEKLGILVAEVEAAAKAVRQHSAEVEAAADTQQPNLF